MENEMKAQCNDLRAEVLKLGNAVNALHQHSTFRGEQASAGQHSEMHANIMLAYRHLENARMRLGKVIQAHEGGRCELDIIARRGKAHVVFGHSHEGQCVTYCGLRWWNGHSPTQKQKHCKNCTRELRKAGMSWRWFEVQQFEAANAQAEARGN